MSKKLLHSHEFAIRWGDMDAYNHLNNTSYFLYIQEARFELLRHYNLEYDGKAECAPILLHTSFNFKKQVTYPESIVVETYLVKVERKKVYLEHVIKSSTQNNLIYGVGDALVMWYDFQRSVTVMPPDEIYHFQHKENHLHINHGVHNGRTN